MNQTKENTEHTGKIMNQHAAGKLTDTVEPRSSLRLLPCAPCFPWFILLFLSAVAAAAEATTDFPIWIELDKPQRVTVVIEDAAGQRADAQWLLCLAAKDGKELWATRLGDPYTNESGDGPRGTPTVRDALVFALGANGELLCAEAATGRERWRTNLTALGSTVPGWGYSESPLVDGPRVMVTPGGEKGAVVALEIKTGQTVSQSKGFIDEAQYTSLMLL